MKPRIFLRKGVWYCISVGAWGCAWTLRDAWESWREDCSIGEVR